MLYAGKGASLGYCLMIQACIMEEEGKEVCKKYFKQNLNLLKLYKMDADYKVMKNYVEERKLVSCVYDHPYIYPGKYQLVL